MLCATGGGWIFGSVDASNDVAVDIAEASGMIVVNVGYRLAPEVKFPVPLMVSFFFLRGVDDRLVYCVVQRFTDRRQFLVIDIGNLAVL